MSYKSPITIMQVEKQIGTKVAEEFDRVVLDAVYEVVPLVDKDELLLALHYDRDQYDKGFADGKVAAMNELVRCKDCKHRGKKIEYGFVAYAYESVCPLCCDDPYYSILKDDDFFCAYGERRSDD